MRLDVRLIHDINSILVTERVPERVVRIVACTHCIDVQLLHDQDILDHVSLGHDISLVRVHLMPVRSLYEDRLSVYKKLASLYADIPESHGYGCLLSPALPVE